MGEDRYPTPSRAAFLFPKNMENECCADCVFWKRNEISPQGNPREAFAGICRLNPPTAHEKGVSWPVTSESDWCGKFERKRSEVDYRKINL